MTAKKSPQKNGEEFEKNLGRGIFAGWPELIWEEELVWLGSYRELREIEQEIFSKNEGPQSKV